jgi:hypothetical protein
MRGTPVGIGYGGGRTALQLTGGLENKTKGQNGQQAKKTSFRVVSYGYRLNKSVSFIVI